MPSWNDLLEDFQRQPDDKARVDWLRAHLVGSLKEISQQRGNRNVILYGSAFLQRPQLPADAIQITHVDLNGLMSCIHGMNWPSGLALVLHTPGGVTNAAETIVSYLRSKFDDIEVIIPAYAMSAGTMISLGANRIIMGRQSQMGPIDPQMVTGGRSVSAQAVVDQFEQAKKDVLKDPAMARVWAPILPSLGPSLLVDARNALSYSELMVRKWLRQWMFANEDQAADKANRAARHFNDAQTHKSHGRRIDRDEGREQGLVVEDLEKSQVFQEAVLTAYHIMTLVFEHTQTSKIIYTSNNQAWLRGDTEPG